MSEAETLSHRLQYERLRAGKSQSAAAKLLDCTPQAISNWERGYTRIDCISLFRLLRWYDADINEFLCSCGLCDEPLSPEDDSEEGQLLRLFRILDGRGRRQLLGIASVLAGEESAGEEAAEKVIPLYRFLAAAGIPSPQPGEDYDEHTVPASSRADFASRIAGDSMEPYIRDGEIVYCQRNTDLRDGDVGIFFARDGMVCKQYCRDSEGNIYLFSLNRERSDADVFLPAASTLPLVCYGKVLLDRRIPLPAEL